MSFCECVRGQIDERKSERVRVRERERREQRERARETIAKR